MKRGLEDPGFSGGPRRRAGDSGPPRSKYGIKALFPDAFASFLLRDRAAAKEHLQQESGARLVFSNKGDFFPETMLRVLGVYSDEPEGVTRALESIVGMLPELAQDERGRPPPAGCEMLGREEGEYIFRLILSRDTTGLLIGSQGANIKEVRRESGAKIVIREDTIAGHRLVTFTGVPDSLVDALRRVNDCMQQEAGSEEFQQYLRVLNFAEAFHEPGKGAGGGGWGQDGSGKGGGYRHQPPPRLDPKASEGLRLLGEDLDRLPRGAAEMSYSVACHLPAQLVPALIGRSGDFVRSIEERTGAKVDISRDPIPGIENMRKMECIGPLLSVYAAHTLMMQRLQEVEQQPPPARRPDRADPSRGWSSHGGHSKADNGGGFRTERHKELEATVAELQRKLSEARAMP
mmetsp:Transcript_26676/g.60207  ORF Transcript_26676/g.60207 Transcript_26676/m.60207 type:complete len:404 (-) Transcript_26676:82-1293(-)